MCELVNYDLPDLMFGTYFLKIAHEECAVQYVPNSYMNQIVYCYNTSKTVGVVSKVCIHLAFWSFLKFFKAKAEDLVLIKSWEFSIL